MSLGLLLVVVAVVLLVLCLVGVLGLVPWLIVAVLLVVVALAVNTGRLRL